MSIPVNVYQNVYKSRGDETTPTFMNALSDTNYQIDFENSTDENYYFAVYQKLPESAGLMSLAWQVRRVPKQIGNQPSTSTVTWTMNYGIAIADWDKDHKKFTGSQTAPATLGNEYEVISQGPFPNINRQPVGTTDPGQIVFKNNTKQPNAMNLAMGLMVGDNLAVVQEVVHANESVNFDVHPTYYVACYRSIELGDLVDSDVQLGPVKVEFENGETTMKVVAYIDAGVYKLKAESS